jgi:hypothetical protein
MTTRLGKLSPFVEIRPIELPGGITLGKKGLEVRGFPSFEQYQAAGAFIQRAHKLSGWWLADWIVYGDSRPDWKDEIDQATGIDELQPQTVRQYRMLAKKFPMSNRIDGAEFGHHAAVAHLEPTVRETLLRQAATEGWTVRELGHAIKQLDRATVKGQAAEVFDIEVGVLVSIEGVTAGAAERAAWDALKPILKDVNSPPWLKATVIAAHARPKVAG